MKKYMIVAIDNLTFDKREDAEQHAEENLKLKEYLIQDIKTLQVWEYIITESNYKYRLTTTGNNSLKYGNCELCNTHSSETYMQTEEHYYCIDENHKGYTRHNCNSYFGCKECLIKIRR